MNNFIKKTEIGFIPLDWEIEKDFLKIKSGFGFKLKEYTESGVPLIRIDNVGYGKITDENLCYLPKSYLEKYKNFTLKKGDILLALNRPITNNQLKIGKVNTEPAILYQRVGCIESINDSFLLDFYYFYLQSPIFIKKLSSILVGSDQPYIKSSEFSKIYFPQPPFKEQKKIASILSIVDELIENTDHLINSYTLLKNGLMQTLLTKGIGHTKFKKTEVGEIPEEWEVKRLNEISIKMQSGGTPLSTIRDYYNGDIPFVKVEDITNSGKYLKSTLTKISILGLKNSSAWIVPINSILYSMYASIGFLSINKIEVSTNQAVINIIVNNKIAIIEYIYYQLLFMKNRILKFIDQTTQKNLNADKVRKFLIPIPKIEEQQKIAFILSAVDNYIDIYKEKRVYLNLLKKGLMQQLLTGKIRVKV